MGNNNQQALESLYQSLRAGNMGLYKGYYQEYKNDFIQFARKFTPDTDLIVDAYHDAFIVLYENVLSRQLEEMTSSLKTYVFSIGKYTLLNKLKKRHRTVYTEGVEGMEMPQYGIVEDLERSESADLLRRHIRSLGDACQSLLILFYYKKYSIEAMMHTLGYKNENTVKAYKSRCLKKLKELMQGAQTS